MTLIAIGLLLASYRFIFAKVSKKQVVAFLSFTAVFIAFISLFNMNYLNSVFTGEAFKSNSVSMRMENFLSVINSPTEVLIWGNGVVLDQIAVYGRYLDSEITVVIAQFGLLGLFAWLSSIGVLMYFGFKKEVYSKLWICLILLFLGTSITNLSFFSTQLGVFLFVILGFSAKHEINVVQKQPNKKT
jgi:hypothetical protein